MEKSTAVRTAIAAGVAGFGLSVGAVAMATSADDTGGTSAATTSAADDGGRGFGDRGPGGPRGGERAAELAEALGVSEAKLEDALEAVHDELRPDAPAEGEQPTPPTEEERAEREAAFAKALAEELDLSEAEVTAALEELHAAHAAEERAALAERLDTALEDGDLTAADKASVLKAFDAGVLGGPGGHGPR